MDGKLPQRRPDKDLVLDRDDEGGIYACLPWSVRNYGTDSFDWGYIGPATAELALNILNWMLPPGVDGEAAIQCEEGECSAVAWRLHRSFMAEFLVRIPYSGGCISEADMRRWVLAHFSVSGEHVPPTKPDGWLSGLISN